MLLACVAIANGWLSPEGYSGVGRDGREGEQRETYECHRSGIACCCHNARLWAQGKQIGYCSPVCCMERERLPSIHTGRPAQAGFMDCPTISKGTVAAVGPRQHLQRTTKGPGLRGEEEEGNAAGFLLRCDCGAAIVVGPCLSLPLPAGCSIHHKKSGSKTHPAGRRRRLGARARTCPRRLWNKEKRERERESQRERRCRW